MLSCAISWYKQCLFWHVCGSMWRQRHQEAIHSGHTGTRQILKSIIFFNVQSADYYQYNLLVCCNLWCVGITLQSSLKNIHFQLLFLSFNFAPWRVPLVEATWTKVSKCIYKCGHFVHCGLCFRVKCYGMSSKWKEKLCVFNRYIPNFSGKTRICIRRK